MKPFSFARIIVTYYPPEVGNFYERVFCLIRNHSVLYVDLLGTCFDILTKPVPLMQRHVDAYRHKVIMGSHKNLKPKDDEGVFNDKSPGQSQLLSSKGVLMADGADLEMPIDDPSQVVLHKEMLHASVADSRDV